MDACLRDIGAVSLACRHDVCEERCCEALKARLQGQCSRPWAHHHALYVSRQRQEIRTKCRRDCVPRLACFFMDSEGPCQSRDCQELFLSGRMTTQCQARITSHCNAVEDAESPQDAERACATFNNTIQVCDPTRMDWLDCAVHRHVGPDWMQDVTLIKSRRVPQLWLSPETVHYIQTFGCTLTPLPNVKAPCPKGFFVTSWDGHTAFRKSAFTTSGIGTGYRDASPENIAVAALVPVFCVLFYLLARLKL